MSTLDHSVTLPAAPMPATWVRLAGRLRSVFKWVRNRNAFAQISTLSDEQLHDIGLRRYDLKEAVGLGDPTVKLTLLVKSRVEQAH